MRCNFDYCGICKYLMCSKEHETVCAAYPEGIPYEFGTSIVQNQNEDCNDCPKFVKVDSIN